MTIRRSLLLSLALALGLAVAVEPAAAQGKGKGKEKKHRAQEEWVDDRYRDAVWYPGDDRYDRDRYDRDRYDDRRRRVPPGWCKGRGNPHNTPENCGYGAYGRYGRYESRGRYDDRGRNGSYGAAHEDFHRYLDWKYSDLAARRPLDLPYQLRIRAEKRAEHADWHHRVGRRH